MIEFPPLVIPVDVTSIDSALRTLDKIYAHPDFIRKTDFTEFRADSIKALTEKGIERVMSHTPDSKIFTLRHHGEGGKTNWSTAPLEEARVPFYLKAAQHPNTYFVDVEYACVTQSHWSPLIELIADQGKTSSNLLISKHDFEGTPKIEELYEQFKSMSWFLKRHEIDGVVKFATLITGSSDLAALEELARRSQKGDYHTTVVGMAKDKKLEELAFATRKKFPFAYEMCWTYVCLDKPNAPGQISLAQVRKYQRERLAD